MVVIHVVMHRLKKFSHDLPQFLNFSVILALDTRVQWRGCCFNMFYKSNSTHKENNHETENGPLHGQEKQLCPVMAGSQLRRF